MKKCHILKVTNFWSKNWKGIVDQKIDIGYSLQVKNRGEIFFIMPARKNVFFSSTEYNFNGRKYLTSFKKYDIIIIEKIWRFVMTTVTDLYTTNQLKFVRGQYNIVDCGVRTGKTYWALNHLKDFTRDGRKDRILFIVDTKSLQRQLENDYEYECTEADFMWESNSTWGEHPDKVGVMCYQGLAARICRNQAQFLDKIDVICWDECDSIFSFALKQFAEAIKKDFNRKGVSPAQVLDIVQNCSSNLNYGSLILLGAWQKWIQESRILCVGLSGTPDKAYQYFMGFVNKSNEGKLETGYRVAQDIYFTNLFDHLKTLSPLPDQAYWCYSPFIEENKKIVAAANLRGFNAIEIHSDQNEDKPMNEEQKRVAACIDMLHMVPPEYDFVVVNDAKGRGLTINDRRFQQVIVNSLRPEMRIQAARVTHPYQAHVKVYAPEIPAHYKERWLTLEECRELAEYMQVPEKPNSVKTMTWNKLKDFLPELNYTIQKEQKRINGKRQWCYYITGEWQNYEVVDEAFEALLNAAYEARELE